MRSRATALTLVCISSLRLTNPRSVFAALLLGTAVVVQLSTWSLTVSGGLISLLAFQLAIVLLASTRGLSLLSVVMAGHLLVFSLPALRHVIKGSHNPFVVVELSLFSLVTLLLGATYFMTRFLFSRHAPLPAQSEIKTLRINVWLAILMFMAWELLFWIELPAGLRMSGLRAQGIMVCLLFMSEVRSYPRLGGQIRIALLAFSLLEFVMSATLYVPLQLLILWGFRVVLFKKYRELVGIAFFVLVMVFAQITKPYLREHLRLHAFQRSVTQKISHHLSSLGYVIQEMGASSSAGRSLVEGVINPVLYRLGDDSIEKVVTLTPRQIPFWEGESYEPLRHAFIPRLLWPGRPSRDLWHRFGKKYGYLGENDHETSITINLFAEGYMNFGLAGLVLTGLLLGFALALLEKLIFRPANPGLNGFFFTLFGSFLLFPTDAVSTVTNLVITFGMVGGVMLALDVARKVRRSPYLTEPAEGSIQAS